MNFSSSCGTLALILALAAPARAAEGWPDLARPAAAVGGGEADAGVVVGIEGYGFVPPVLRAVAGRPGLNGSTARRELHDGLRWRVGQKRSTGSLSSLPEGLRGGGAYRVRGQERRQRGIRGG